MTHMKNTNGAHDFKDKRIGTLDHINHPAMMGPVCLDRLHAIDSVGIHMVK